MANKDAFKIIPQPKKLDTVQGDPYELVFDFKEINRKDAKFVNIFAEIDFNRIYRKEELRELIERINEMSPIESSSEEDNECDLVDVYPRYARFMFKITQVIIEDEEGEEFIVNTMQIVCIYPESPYEQ